MGNLSRSEAANLTMSILQSTTRNYINIPDEYINYAAAAGLYVTRNWPGDNPISNLPSANARGPEMANAITQYVALCAKTLSFSFTRTGSWNLTADPFLPLQGPEVLAAESQKPPAGSVARFQAYYPVNNGAGGNGQRYDAVSSFRQINGPATYSASGTRIRVQQATAAENSQYSSNFQLNIDNVGSISRFAVTSAGFDDFTALFINGRCARVYNRYVLAMGNMSAAATDMVLAYPWVNLGAAGQVALGAEGPGLFYRAVNDDLRPYLVQGVNNIELRYINYRTEVNCYAEMELVQTASGPGLNPAQLQPDAPGYAAVVSGNASYSALVNLLNNLAGKLYNYMVNNVYSVTYCHTNCHNNCHASRGRR